MQQQQQNVIMDSADLLVTLVQQQQPGSAQPVINQLTQQPQQVTAMQVTADIAAPTVTTGNAVGKQTAAGGKLAVNNNNNNNNTAAAATGAGTGTGGMCDEKTVEYLRDLIAERQTIENNNCNNANNAATQNVVNPVNPVNPVNQDGSAAAAVDNQLNQSPTKSIVLRLLDQGKTN
jgi:hypothetical protein